jgi:hypothetical protein
VKQRAELRSPAAIPRKSQDHPQQIAPLREDVREWIRDLRIEDGGL